MKVLNILEAYNAVIEERDMPVITEPDQVIVKVRAVGICGSDMAAWIGAPTRKLPLVPCHEFSGEVYEIGGNVADFSVGDRVAVEPMITCGECYACRSGRSNVCKSLKTVGSHCDGAVQEYFLTTKEKLHRIPDNMSFAQATLVEPYTIGAQVNERMGTKPGDKVLIHGAGPIGIITMLVAKQIGAEVAISQRSAGRREFAKKIGADLVIDPVNEDIKEKIEEFTDGKGPDVIIDSAGVPDILSFGIMQLGNGGRLGNICFAQKEVDVNIHELVSKRASVHGSRLQTNQFEKVIRDYSDLILENDCIITDRFKMDDAVEAFKLFGSRSENTCKIVIEC